MAGQLFSIAGVERNQDAIGKLFGNDAIESIIEQGIKGARECFRASDVMARVKDN
jgi:hypothetical protein